MNYKIIKKNKIKYQKKFLKIHYNKKIKKSKMYQFLKKKSWKLMEI